MLVTDIIKGYLTRRTDKLLEELILVVSDLSSSIEDMNDRQLSLENAIKQAVQPRRIIKNGKIEAI